MLYIIRGLPGAGKSTLANKMSSKFGIEHYETDMFFIDKDGNYLFDWKRIGPAHEWCIRQVMAELYNEKSVIVSNTFTRFWELEEYIAVADRLLIPVTIIECLGDYGSIHNVPTDVVEKMKKRYIPNQKLNILSKTKIHLKSCEEFTAENSL
jgi:predicted kinase